MKVALLAVTISGLMLAACDNSSPTAPPEANQAAAPAASANAADSIRARQTHYKEIGKAMKGIGDELKGSSPDVAAIQAHAARMQEFAPQIEGWFPQGSGSEVGLKTRAKQEIWSDPQGFSRAAQSFVAEAGRFHGVAQAGNVEAIRAAAPVLGATCKGCHDKFRAPEE